jgi:hypothetical protein
MIRVSRGDDGFEEAGANRHRPQKPDNLGKSTVSAEPRPDVQGKKAARNFLVYGYGNCYIRVSFVRLPRLTAAQEI